MRKRILFASQLEKEIVWWRMRFGGVIIPHGAVVIVVETAYQQMPVDLGGKFSHGEWFVSDGWNGSYHDCRFDPIVVIWASGPHKLRRIRRQFRKLFGAAPSSAPRVDSSTARFEARRQVREGD